jgi:hypothetical protein
VRRRHCAARFLETPRRACLTTESNHALRVGGRAEGGSVSKFRDQWSKKEWKKCCGKGCKKCDIANAYIDEYGSKAGQKKLKKDHAKMN